MTLTDALAIYAGLLSTGTFIWTIRQARHSLKVRAILGLSDGGDGKAQTSLVIHLLNAKGMPAEARFVGVAWPYRRVSFSERVRHMTQFRNLPRWIGWVHGQLPESTTTGLPVLIEPGRSHEIWVPLDELRNSLKADRADVCVAYAQDALGQQFYSNQFQFPSLKA